MEWFQFTGFRTGSQKDHLEEEDHSEKRNHTKKEDHSEEQDHSEGGIFMDHEHFIKLQDETLKTAVGLLEKEPAVVGLVLYGSVVNGMNDAFSDIDMICYLSTPDETVIGNLISRIANIHPLLSKLWIYGKNSLFLYCNGIRLDLDILPEEEIRNLQADRMKILYDPSGKISSAVPEKKSNQPMHPKYFKPGQEVTDWFFWMFRQVYCWIKRGAQGGERSFDIKRGAHGGERSFEKLYAAYASMNEMRQVLIEMRRWTLGSDGYWQIDDPGFAALLLGTFSSLSPDDMLKAVRSLFVAFEYACGAYCVKSCTDYPSEKIVTMKTMLDIFDALD
jgi:predicted nucleotidyltransferase